MTTKLIDGPAEATVLELARAPVFLRVVIDWESKKVDALDLLEDTPAASEVIFIYRRAGKPSSYFACSRRTRSGGGCQAGFWCEYYLYENQPPDIVCRDRARWEAWAVAEAAKLIAHGSRLPWQ